jgi:hypothetical protein
MIPRSKGVGRHQQIPAESCPHIAVDHMPGFALFRQLRYRVSNWAT